MKNPLFHQEVRMALWKKILFSILGVGGSTGLLWLIFFGPFSGITQVSVTGLTTIPNTFIENATHAQMEYKSFGFFPERSRYLFRVKAFEAQLQALYDFEYLSVVIHGGTLEIEAKERLSQFVYQSGDVFSFIGLDGKLTRLLYDFEIAQISERLNIPCLYLYDGSQALPLQPAMPIIVDASAPELIMGTEILFPMNAETIIAFNESLSSLLIHPVYYLRATRTDSWLSVMTEEGFEIYIDGTRGVGEQEEILKTVIAEYRDRLETIDYIDVRFGNHVYIK
jgi:hypothetical protein